MISTSKLKETIKRVLTHHPEVLIAYLYGSRVKGYSTPESDVDLGILIEENYNTFPLYPEQLSGEIMKETGYSMDVDIRILNHRNSRFVYTVIKEGELIYCRDEKRRVEFETEATRKYLDFKHIHEEYDAMRRQRLMQ
jgi:hypothetical protein